MDYVFFAFSSMCFGLAVLLAIQPFFRPERPLRLWWLVPAGIAAAAFYYLQINLFQKRDVWLYLANMLPQAALLIELAVMLMRRKRN